jgi:NAD(P)-dependent dehydrogenase (short-subunit alcohol dehydrogenase family)
MGRSVLVTGASTGIGEATARRLRDAGWDVVAGARKDADLERLRGEGLTPVRLDVTDRDSIAAAREQIGDRPLAGLVNNAGVAVSAPIELVPLADLRQQLEVNLVGQVAVIQTFLPAVRDGKGRIVNVSSIGGRIALPMVGPYAASKFALEAVSDSLRRELRPWGIGVCVVEPGAVKTPIWEKGVATADRLQEEMGEPVERLYGPLVERIRAETAKVAERGVDPDDVARTIEHALTARRPKLRYVVGRDAKLRLKIKALVGDRGFDGLVARTLNWR